MWGREGTKRNIIPCPYFSQAGWTSAWGFLGSAALACLRGGEKSCPKHTGLKAEMGSHLSYNKLLGTFPAPFLFPLSVREVSALRAVRTCPAWPKETTRLSRFPQDTIRPPKFLSTFSIRAHNLSHCAAICIRNAPCFTPVLKHGPKDALHLAGQSSHVLSILLGSV